MSKVMRRNLGPRKQIVVLKIAFKHPLPKNKEEIKLQIEWDVSMTAVSSPPFGSKVTNTRTTRPARAPFGFHVL
jgi:hypothetical protein